MDPIARVAKLRRTLTACLYCPASPEHVLGEAVGGRLSAPILCATQHMAVSVSADGRFAHHFETLTFAVGARPHRGGRQGKTGTTVRSIDRKARRTTVLPDGRPECRLESNATPGASSSAPPVRCARSPGSRKMIPTLNEPPKSQSC